MALFAPNYGIPARSFPEAEALRRSVRERKEYGHLRTQETEATTSGSAQEKKEQLLIEGPAGSKPSTALIVGGGKGTKKDTFANKLPEAQNTEKKRAPQEPPEMLKSLTRIEPDEKERPTYAMVKKNKREDLMPEWHAPWKLYRVVSGHTGWVRSIAVDVSNEWFVTGSADRTVKLWDLASGSLKLTLTGHISAVRGCAISPRHPYMFTCGEDKQVKCWDLEMNKVVRHYHGHLSGVYSIDLHPAIDVLVTGSRDSSARVWDMRTKASVFCLSGHDSTVNAVKCQAPDPQIVTASADTTVRTWDLRTGKTHSVLTNHKRGVRALALNEREFTYASASADNIKVWKFPDSEFMRNVGSMPKGASPVINALALNDDGVMFSGGDQGTLMGWDWRTGYNFQQLESQVQPGSLDSEAGIYAMSFDRSGSRLITCEADKTIKMYKEDDMATPETHPIDFAPAAPGTYKRY